MSKIYTVTKGDGTKQDIIADDVVVQTTSADGKILYRFVEFTANPAPNDKISVAYITCDDQAEITSVPGPSAAAAKKEK